MSVERVVTSGTFSIDGGTWDGVLPTWPGTTGSSPTTGAATGRSAHKPVQDHRLHARDLTAVLDRVAREPADFGGYYRGPY